MRSLILALLFGALTLLGLGSTAASPIAPAHPSRELVQLHQCHVHVDVQLQSADVHVATTAVVESPAPVPYPEHVQVRPALARSMIAGDVRSLQYSDATALPGRYGGPRWHLDSRWRIG
ncbi:hypothetical protein [Hymenobacter sp. B81]|uniref:hypothetical protein n=1 Tax=Hymenobacter sp. B81 TaxID=3344878 RepID=UPI0037DD49DF